MERLGYDGSSHNVISIGQSQEDVVVIDDHLTESELNRGKAGRPWSSDCIVVKLSRVLELIGHALHPPVFLHYIMNFPVRFIPYRNFRGEMFSYKPSGLGSGGSQQSTFLQTQRYTDLPGTLLSQDQSA